MWTFDAKFYKRNAVLEEQPFWLVPAKWMAKAQTDDYSFNPASAVEGVSPRILHSCKHGRYHRGESHGEFLPDDLDHDFRCEDCKMRPSDKMITLFTLLK